MTRHKPIQSRKWRPRPAEVMVLGFAVMIAVGTVLLQLPSAALGKPLNFIDALFTATSAVCVTGLSVFDPGSTLSFYGQFVLLVLIQCGGLGFMTITCLVYSATHHRLTVTDSVLLGESLNESRLSAVSRITARILFITGICEGVGAIILMMRFIPEYGIIHGIWYSFFHAISSFCNAGFDVFGVGNNLIPFVGDPLVNVVTMALIVLGGLGFFVIMELVDKLAGTVRSRLSLHTKVVLTMTGALLVGGFLLFFIAESSNPATLGSPKIPWSERIMGSWFQSVSSRTAGFMTVNQGALRPVSQFGTIFLMFVGASPAGTAGGLKTTTFAATIAFVWSVLQGNKDVNLFRRRLDPKLVNRAIAIFIIGIGVVSLVACAITVLEVNLKLGDVLFEVTSAFSTTGLSVGITAYLSDPSLVLLVLTMFGGRVGFFTLTLALAYRMASHQSDVSYAKDRIVIG